MLVKKYVLVIDDPDGEVATGIDDLQRHGYEVSLAPDLQSALTIVAGLERLSLVVVNCRRFGGGYEDFLASLRGSHPNLPVIWLGNSREIVANFLEAPATGAADSNVAVLKADATKLLRERFYSNDLVREVVNASEAVLREFGVETKRSDPYIKSNLSALGDVNALLGFSGEGLSGHVILSASTERATQLHRTFEPSRRAPEYDDLEDLMGEITNRVLGAVKRVFESRSLSCKLRTPAFIRGAGSRYRSKGSSPSLAVEFADERGLLRLEFCIDRMNPVVVTGEEATFIEAGRIEFL
jgi:chemotaxis protein CheX